MHSLYRDLRYINRIHMTNIRSGITTNGIPGPIAFSNFIREERRRLHTVFSCRRFSCYKSLWEESHASLSTEADPEKSPNSFNYNGFTMDNDKANREMRKAWHRKNKEEKFKLQKKTISRNESKFRDLMTELEPHANLAGPASFSAPFTIDRGNGTLDFDFDALLKSEEDIANDLLERKSKVIYAVLLSYRGYGYHGLQINNAVPTIEGEVLRAMVELDLVPAACLRTPQLVSFQRAARTDKGVSAARQVINLRLPIPRDQAEKYVDLLNARLPESIRIMDIVRASRSFNSKNSCESRTYSYLTPTFAFAPIDRVVNDNYRMSQEDLANVRQLFSLYEGSNNFHNFTILKKPTDKSAIRFIISIECGEPFERDGLEWIHIRLKGQSFMMHQIRKMVGLVMCVCRGIAPPSIMEESLSHATVETAKAPGLGLVLEQPHYPRYDKKQLKDHERLDWSGSGIVERVSTFRRDVIDKDIVTREASERSMFNFLELLHRFSFTTSDDSGLRKARRLLDEVSEDDSQDNLEYEKRILLGDSTPNYRSKRLKETASNVEATSNVEAASNVEAGSAVETPEVKKFQE